MNAFPPSQAETELWNALVTSLLTLRPDAWCDFGTGEDKIGDDSRLLAELLDAGEPRSLLRLWNNDRRLVISRRVARSAGAGRVTALSRKSGWPVSVRASGGTTVAHRDGILNVSLFNVSHEPRKLTDGFDDLCRIIVTAARRTGFELDVGPHAHSYCSGSHDIGWRGRKLAGTAGLARRRGELHAYLFHASLVVYGDWRADVAAISAFEHALGMQSGIVLQAHTSLAEIRYCAARSSLGEQPNFSL